MVSKGLKYPFNFCGYAAAVFVPPVFPYFPLFAVIYNLKKNTLYKQTVTIMVEQSKDQYGQQGLPLNTACTHE